MPMRSRGTVVLLLFAVILISCVVVSAPSPLALFANEIGNSSTQNLVIFPLAGFAILLMASARRPVATASFVPRSGVGCAAICLPEFHCWR